MSIPDVQDVVDALLPVLRSYRLEVGDGEAPDAYAELYTEEDPGYGIVDVLPGPPATGDIARPASMRAITLQLTGVGSRRDQAQWASMQMLHAVLDVGPNGYTNTIDPKSCIVIHREHVGSGGVQHEDTLFNSVELVQLTVSV